MWLDTITMAFGHSFIGIAPPIINSEKFEEARLKFQKTDIQSFGLFDSAAPNFTTYYPDVNAEDLAPKDGDFVFPIFRALSEVTVHKAWNPVSFSKNGVLKKSLNMLKGQTIYPNHEAMVGNELGAIAETIWEESYKAEGVQIPAGINARLKIDGKSHPNIARAVMMDPPSVHSTSVTVQFLWDKSHAAMTEEEFFRKLGTYDKDGRLIERVATEVKRYNEISLVPHGADPFAQRVNDKGVIVNPKFADSTYKLSAQEKKEQKFFFFDYKEDIIKNSTIPEGLKEETSQNSEKMDKLLALIALTAAGIKFTLPKENTEANLTENETALNAAIGSIKLADDTELGRLRNIETSYNAIKDKDIPGLESFKTTAITNARNKVLGIYTKLSDNKPDQGIVALIANSDLVAVEALGNQYQVSLDEKFPLTCSKCNSTQVSRKSSISEQGDGGNEGDKNEDGTVISKLDEYVKRKQGVFGIHQTGEVEAEPAK